MFTTSLTANDLLFLLQGAWTTLAITAMAMLIGTLLGVVFGLLRALLPRASLPLAALLDVFRSVPLLIQFVLLNSFKSILGLDWSAFAVACLVLGVYAAADHLGAVGGGVHAEHQAGHGEGAPVEAEDALEGIEQDELDQQRHAAEYVEQRRQRQAGAWQ
ncbi:hypothetical protein ACV336_29845, partial [Pseudomonas aeruginosa]